MPPRPDETTDAQRALMDRARQRAEARRQPLKRSLLPRLLGLGGAGLAALIVLLAFDQFLTALQRFFDTPVKQTTPAPAPSGSVPVFVVEEPPATAPVAEPAPDNRER